MAVKYAERTTVSAGQSREEISKLLKKYGASKFAYLDDEEQKQAIVGFELRSYTYRFIIKLPGKEQEIKSRWRAMVAAIKGKLISVDNGIETFEDAFFRYTVVPGTGGKTAAEYYGPQIAQAYQQGKDIKGLLS